MVEHRHGPRNIDTVEHTVGHRHGGHRHGETKTRWNIDMMEHRHASDKTCFE